MDYDTDCLLLWTEFFELDTMLKKYPTTRVSVLIIWIFTIEVQCYDHLTWKRSQVFEPSPQGVLRVVMRKVLVGIRTGP